ncbi:hypothetical protein CDAR_95301 [Caerostris darwini]|uniref:Uncharacterized protein n=1 Tax=Caerostris darwini TaxID=1538125 RepID=A0AAV4PM93_9ARAC|nr:hypothetical protein CDAR_95301 [Caerostris darwini]
MPNYNYLYGDSRRQSFQKATTMDNHRNDISLIKLSLRNTERVLLEMNVLNPNHGTPLSYVCCKELLLKMDADVQIPKKMGKHIYMKHVNMIK